jgi:hypothetical protein
MFLTNHIDIILNTRLLIVFVLSFQNILCKENAHAIEFYHHIKHSGHCKGQCGSYLFLMDVDVYHDRNGAL